ncbi:MAG: ATP-binding protein [Prevotellaceae bacterium]|jgi:predicted AAA+ superfamily ATPase|nr:ATP-binding protein [Prevotellaceae bacterium]
MYFSRNISEIILQTSETFPVVLITGPRQVGKSTVSEQIKEENRSFVTLDDPSIRVLAQTDPALFLQTYEPPVLIDEVQYAPQLFPHIKMIVDKRKEKGLFWLTGSQPFQLMEKVSESLAGRVGILELQGLSQAEKNQTAGEPFLPENLKISNRKPYNVNSIYNLILKGSFPELYATPKLNRNTFYSSYLKTYIERDIRELTNVQDERLFLTFLKVVAARTGQLLNYADIAKDVGIAENTVKSWISLLLTSGLVFLLQPYHNNLTNRAIKTPKLHFMDTGLCAYLCGWTSAETLSVGAMSGAIFESYVVGEIMKSYIHNNVQAHFYFYRDKEKQEIDLVIERDNIFYPIEIKRTASPQQNDVKTFSLLEKMGVQAGKGAIVCLYENLLPLSRDVQIVPIGYLG